MLQVIDHILKAPKCSTPPLTTIDDLGTKKTNHINWYMYLELIICIFKFVYIEIWILRPLKSCIIQILTCTRGRGSENCPLHIHF